MMIPRWATYSVRRTSQTAHLLGQRTKPIKEAFTINGNDGEGIIEQIYGVIEIDG